MMNVRKLHRQVSPFLILPIFATALTGVVYRFSRRLGIPDEVSQWIMKVHSGSFLSSKLSLVYVLMVGSGLLGLIITGLVLWQKKRKAGASQTQQTQPHRPSSQLDWRQMHRLLAPLISLPLILTTLTGVAYPVSKAWFGWSYPETDRLMKLHEGAFLGPLKSFYVLWIGLGLIALLVTGINLTSLFRRRKQPPIEPSN
jgi:uncharacterized iron-regulated membrane protein